MADLTGLAKLQSEHKVFQFRNRTGAAKTIQLAGGDTVQVQPGAIGKVASAGITQLPAFSDFEPVVPNTAQLIAAGLIGETTEADPVPAKSAADKAEDKQTGGQPLKSTSKSSS